MFFFPDPNNYLPDKILRNLTHIEFTTLFADDNRFNRVTANVNELTSNFKKYITVSILIATRSVIYSSFSGEVKGARGGIIRNTSRSCRPRR